MKFKKWLEKQIKEETLSLIEQDFAEDVVGDKKFRDFRDWDKLENYLIFNRAVPEALKAAKRCFDKWAGEDSYALIDGLGLKDIERLRRVTRQVWSWSHPKRLCIERSTDHEGFQFCKKCYKKVPKIYVDHKKAVGKIDSGYLDRLFCPSSGLQALCKECHQKKTNAERRVKKDAAKKKTSFWDS